MSPSSSKTWQQALETETKPDSDPELRASGFELPLLTVLWHTDSARVGECCWLPELAEGRSISLSRLTPIFGPVDGSDEGRPLAEPRVSRQPIRLTPHPEGLSISTGSEGTPLEIDGEPLSGSRMISEAELSAGLVLLLAGRVALLLHRTIHAARSTPTFDLVGESAAVWKVRSQIDAVSDLDLSVLIRGESGTGKELVARAIQSHSSRRERAYLTVNMAAVPPTLAASELFGAVRGAFSGADRSRSGFFKRADGGTLFLDEIGETPREVQALLLRILESGEIQPVGGERSERVDVRVIAATDADLEAGITKGTFASSLLQRLRSFEISLPPLRDRIEDLGRLFLYFLSDEMRLLGSEDRLAHQGPYVQPFVSARLVARLARHPWPGNVRELRNEVRQLAVASRNVDTLATGDWLADLARRPSAPAPTDGSPQPESPETTRRAPNASYRDQTDVGEEEMLEILAAQDWNIKATAEALGVSRASLYNRVQRSPNVRKAKDLSAAEIISALESHDRQLEAAARALRVSKQGLKRQLHRLNLS